MPRIEIGIGAIIAAIAGLGLTSSVPVNVSVLFFGIVLVINGVYDVYLKPNIWLDKSLRRWLLRPRLEGDA